MNINKLKDAYVGIKDVINNTLFQKSLNSTLAGVVNSRMVYYDMGDKDAFKTNYTVNRAVRLLAEGIAQLPVQIYRGDTLLEPDARLQQGFNLKRPHPRTSLYKLLKEASVHYFLEGDMMLYIDLEAPFSLEVVNPTKMKRQKNGTWKYNNSIIIPDEQLIHVSNFDPSSTDGKGLSLIDVVSAELSNDAKALEYSQMYYKNFTNIGGTLVSTDKDRPATKEQMDDATRAFNMKNASSANAHKTVGLYGGIKYEQQTQSMHEMDFLESRKDVRDKILAVYGIHKCLLGATDSVDRAVSLEATRQLWNQTLIPQVIAVQEEFNSCLFNRYFPGYRCVFDMSGIDALRQSVDVKMKQVEIYRAMGYTTNELNERFDLNMEEVTDPVGDMRFVPTSLIPVDDLYLDDTDLKASKSNANKSTSSIKSINLDDLDCITNKSNTIDKVVDIVLEEEKLANQEREIANKSRATRTYVRRYNKTLRLSEKRVASKLGKYFSKQLGKVMGLVKGDGNSDLNTLLASIQNLINEEKTILQDTMKPVYKEGSADAVKLANATINKKAARADYIDEVVESMTNKIVGISDTTYKLIRNQVKTSITEGETVNELAKRIQSVYKFNSSRVRTIARTESGMLVSRSSDKVYKDNNVEKKQWVANLDECTRETHSANHSAGTVKYSHVYDNGQSFPSDGVGGASENINCRCCIAPVIE